MPSWWQAADTQLWGAGISEPRQRAQAEVGALEASREPSTPHKAADTNLKGHTDFPGHQLLHGCQHDWIADLLPLTIPLYLPVQCWGLPSFCMGVVRPHCVYLGRDERGPSQN